MPEAMNHKAFATDISVVDGERAVLATISTGAVDRDGEVCIPQGCRTIDYELNPVIMFAHDYFSLPVGKCVSIQRTADAIVAKAVFAERPDNHPTEAEWFPDTLFSLYQQKVLNAFSVGFETLETRRANDADRLKFGDSVKRITSKWNLLEFSVAPIPVNQEAVAIAVSKGFVRSATAKSVFGYESSTSEPPPHIATPAEIVEATKEMTQAVAKTNTAEAEAVQVVEPAVVVEQPPELASEPPKIKRMVVVLPPPERIVKKISVVEVASEAVQKARGRIYAK